MTIQIPNVGTGVPADQTGDSPWLAMKKVGDNFSNNTHAASRLVGTAAGNVMEVGAFGLGGNAKNYTGGINGFVEYNRNNTGGIYFSSIAAVIEKNTGKALPQYSAYLTSNTIDGGFFAIGSSLTSNEVFAIRGAVWSDATSQALPLEYLSILHSKNTLKDSNGFIKAASPVVDLYDKEIILNDDAEKQDITFKRLGVGDYLVEGSLGFAQEGWYIETPKDANGNVLVAVVYEQLENNDLSIKTYAKKFDDETGDIVANLLKPRDIPTGRFISLRLHELPKPSPVTPTETQTEV